MGIVEALDRILGGTKLIKSCGRSSKECRMFTETAEQTTTKQGHEKENKSVVVSIITAGQPGAEITRPFPCLERGES